MKDIFVYFKAYIRNGFLDLLWVLIFSVLVFFLVSNLMRKQKKKQSSNPILSNVCGMLLSLECSFIFVLTLFKREVVCGNTFDFRVCGSYIEVFTEENPELILQVIMNVAVFIPIGFLMPCCFGFFEKYRYVLLTTFTSSLCIELIQGIFKIGYFEIVDIINNLMGSIIGLLIYAQITRVKKCIKYRRNSGYERKMD